MIKKYDNLKDALYKIETQRIILDVLALENKRMRNILIHADSILKEIDGKLLIELKSAIFAQLNQGEK
jgi:hypothetical protein